MKKYFFENNDIKKWVAVSVALLAVAAKLILAWGQYATVYPPLAPIDDHLMFTAAQNIVAGNWLGAYGHLTISKHMFLSIHIIRDIARLRQHLRRQTYHPHRVVLHAKVGTLLQHNVGGTLHRQGMHRHTLGIQRQNTIQSSGKALVVIARQTGDQIGVDIGKSGFSRHFKGIVELLHRMLTTNTSQHSRLQSLRIDADTGNSAFFGGNKLESYMTSVETSGTEETPAIEEAPASADTTAA